MWDDHSTKITYPEKIYHTHNHAPTDESIKIAIEYEEKILKRIIDKFQCVDNKINISILKLYHPLDCQLAIKISINGNEYENLFRQSLNFDETINEISNWIANNIVKPIIDDLFFCINIQNK